MRIFILGLLLFLFGCSKDDTRQIKMLAAKVDSLTSAIREKDEWRDLIERSDRVAFLKPSNQGFSTIKTDMGSITVSIENVTPYANGSRVTLSFGNATSATINGLKMDIDWGETDKNGDAIRESEKTKSNTLLEPLVPGYWNATTLILEDIRPENLGYIRIREVEFGGVSFHNR